MNYLHAQNFGLEFFSRKKFLDKFFQNFEIDSKIPLLALY